MRIRFTSARQVLSVLIVFILQLINSNGQELSSSISENGIIISAKLNSIKKANNSFVLGFEYSIKNESKDDIYFVTRGQEEFNYQKKTHIEDIFINLGGFISHFPNYRSPLSYWKILDKHSDSLFVEIKDSLGTGILHINNDWFVKKNVNTVIITLCFGYFIDNHNSTLITENLKHIENDIYTININKDGLKLDNFYRRRFISFPVVLSDIETEDKP